MEIKISAEPSEVAALFAKLGISVNVSDGELIASPDAPVERARRMKTSKRAYEAIKEMDPNTQITESTIYRIYKQRMIPIVESGRKKLADFDVLLDYLSNPDKYRPKETHETGKIRTIGGDRNV